MHSLKNVLSLFSFGNFPYFGGFANIRIFSAFQMDLKFAIFQAQTISVDNSELIENSHLSFSNH